MLTILGAPQRVCQGVSRRELLQAGGACLLGVSLSSVLHAEAVKAPAAGSAKSVLFLYIYGGPSQLETFDMKPEAPSGIRGPFKSIDSRTPGLRICEHLPQLAARSDQYAIVRTLNHTHNNHHACHWIKTGRPWHLPETVFNATAQDWPSMGSIVEYLAQHAPGGAQRTLSDYVYLPAPLGHLQGYDYAGQYAGWLGKAYNALATNFRRRDKSDNPYFREVTDAEMDLQIQGLDAQPDVTIDRLDRRRTLLDQFDDSRRRLDAGQNVQTYSKLQQRALALSTSTRLRTALDVRQESAAMRDRYGRHLFGQATLLGRRMIEAGARFVTVQWEAPDGYSWDSHIHSNDIQKYLCPALDQTLSALLDDLSQRGLLDETLVLLVSEIGRTPNATPTWGRGHWCHAFPALMAGGGISGGTLYGRTDKDAGYPADRPVSPADLAATVFHALGIDHELRIPDTEGRPVSLVAEGGQPLTELFG
ncbi:MAG: DUF1501 domain-containing protein [Planctomycetaceae bacterium]|nr:DUF1501 domain-containing protein [Planctomycetaceae bacterium]